MAVPSHSNALSSSVTGGSPIAHTPLKISYKRDEIGSKFCLVFCLFVALLETWSHSIA